MRESNPYAALILAGACACEPSPGPPPAAPAAVVPVASASAAPLAVEPAAAAPPETASETDHDAPPPDLASHSEPNGPPPPLPSSGTGTPFDRGRAAAALGAVNVQTCANGTSPRGNGHVRITFATSGHVRAVVLDQGPFMGTATGTCILGRYRAVQVPPFGGAEVSVGKSFTVK